MRMRAGVQHHTATRACKSAASALFIKTLAGNSCESGRVRHPPDRECSRVANAWWNYIVSHAQGFTGFLVATREHSKELSFDANAGRTTSGAMGVRSPVAGKSAMAKRLAAPCRVCIDVALRMQVELQTLNLVVAGSLNARRWTRRRRGPKAEREARAIPPVPDQRDRSSVR